MVGCLMLVAAIHITPPSMVVSVHLGGLKDSLLDVKHLLDTLSVKLLKCIKAFVFYAKLCLHSKLCLCVFWIFGGCQRW